MNDNPGKAAARIRVAELVQNFIARALPLGPRPLRRPWENARPAGPQGGARPGIAPPGGPRIGRG